MLSLDEYSKGHLERIFSDRQVCFWLTMAGKNQFAADIKQFCSLYGVGEVEIQMKFPDDMHQEAGSLFVCWH